MFSIMPRGSYLDERISKTYSKDVLLSTWQERRGGNYKPNDCIVPGLARVNACELHDSEFQSSFTIPVDPEEHGEGTRNFLERRHQMLLNWMLNSKSQVKFPLTKELKYNYTTTTKIFYDILPQQRLDECLKAAAVSGKPGVPLPLKEVDLLKSYGNRNVTGKNCEKKEEMALYSRQRMQTTYAATYDLASQIFKWQPSLYDV
ncbi:uncharacterized protein LOC108599813 [Drosophila busckii]|uniref:uncharacterized protein LOC108599813 n=1 Tax=Drosophila busckii TaxID=30019 RepID=UPI001432ADA5|nr:uncharacterized protein LOC108599813 [Drosophila busckii]